MSRIAGRMKFEKPTLEGWILFLGLALALAYSVTRFCLES